jgi:S1-C subfamily serine protease
VPHRLLALVLALLAVHASAAEDRPSHADLRKALALYERSGVRVGGSRQAGPGIIVGTEGQVLTSVRYVKLDTAQVEYDGKVLPATVVLANAYLKVAVVAAPPGTYPAAPVKLSDESPTGQWLIGILRARGKQKERPEAALARKAPEPFIDVDLPLLPGSPLFDTSGKLVAVSVQRRGPGCRALPLDVVKKLLATNPQRVASP